MNLLPGGSAPTAFVNYKAKARSGIDLSGPAIVWLEGLSFFLYVMLGSQPMWAKQVL